MITPEEVRDCFNDSFLSTFFQEFDSAEGQEYILMLSNYALDCGNGKYIHENCPAVFCCWASHYIAWLLATWANVDVQADGSVSTPDVAAASPQLYLKKKTVGGKTCEWDIVDVSKLASDCVKCPEDQLDIWKSRWVELLECCLEANTCPFIAGGSFYFTEQKKSHCCGVDEGWHTYY